MKSYIAFGVVVCCILHYSCNQSPSSTDVDELSLSSSKPVVKEKPMLAIRQIPLPAGYARIRLNPNSFSNWLRNLPLKKSNVIYLYNGQVKENQHDHYAVIDISTGKQNLQQCADALMRLRAEYLYSVKAYEQISFVTGNGKPLSFNNYAKGERYALAGQLLTTHTISISRPCYDHKCLMQFLNNVFNYCSTYSLKVMCKPKQLAAGIMPGDVFVKAGSPGHAMMVADVAVNVRTGKKIYLLLQDFMPAQDVHIVRNPANISLSPWYELNSTSLIQTPGWTFKPTDFCTW